MRRKPIVFTIRRKKIVHGGVSERGVLFLNGNLRMMDTVSLSQITLTSNFRLRRESNVNYKIRRTKRRKLSLR
jgi:hypothetical protein